MSLLNIALTDTFDVWRVRTNQIIVKLDGLETSNVFSVISNSSPLIVSGNGYRYSNTYLTLVVSSNTADVSTTNLASPFLANTAREIARSAYTQANAANITAGSAYGQANTITTTAVAAFDMANSVNTTAAGAFEQANLAQTFANNKVDKTGDTMSGNLTISKLNPALTFNAAASAQTAQIQFLTAGLKRWVFYKTAATESGGNTGSTLALNAYDDSGAFIDSVLVFERPATGLMYISRPLSLTKALGVSSGGTGATEAAGARANIGATSIINVFTALNNQPPASNYATVGSRNSHPTLLFDATTQEAAIFGGVFPSSYASQNVTVTIWASMVSATTGTLGWDIAFENMNGLDLDADSFATAKTATATTVSGTSGVMISHSVTFTSSEIDGIVAGDPYRLRIRRDVANDTATGDAELVRVKVEIV